MRPAAEASPEFVGALRQMLLRIQAALADTPKRLLPVRMTIAGGAALHCYIGTRVPRDVDATFTRRLAFPDDIDVVYRDADGLAQYLFLDRAYNSTPGLFHEDADEDAVPLALQRRCSRCRRRSACSTATDRFSAKAGGTNRRVPHGACRRVRSGSLPRMPCHFRRARRT